MAEVRLSEVSVHPGPTWWFRLRCCLLGHRWYRLCTSNRAERRHGVIRDITA